MLKLTEQKAREFVTSKGGVVDKILEENGKHYFYITCKLGHHFKKEKSKLAFTKKQYCNYYPCSKGIKSEWRDEQGFKIFKERLSEIFGDDVISTEKEPLTSERLSVPFNFECGKCKHKWSNEPSYQLTTPLKKKKPPSCKKCGGSSPITIEQKEAFLKELNIVALDEVSSIVNMQEKFRYKCNECSSINKKTLNNLDYLYKNKLGYCDCSYKRIHWTLEKLILEGKSKGYKLQGKPDEINTSDSYKWKCIKKGHITSFAISCLKNGCNICYNEKRFTSLVKIEKWLKSNAPTIELLPNQTWKGSNNDYEYKCSVCKGIFTKYLHNLIKFPYCKYISRSNSELVVNFYLEKLLGIKFEGNKQGFNWLTNSKGGNMILDGYNDDQKIAFEHNGIQHYEQIEAWQNLEDFKRRQEDDKLKVEKCEENNIKLIIIPTLFITIPLEDLKKVIKEELIRLKIDIPRDFDKINPKTSEMIVYHTKKKQKNV